MININVIHLQKTNIIVSYNLHESKMFVIYFILLLVSITLLGT